MSTCAGESDFSRPSCVFEQQEKLLMLKEHEIYSSMPAQKELPAFDMMSFARLTCNNKAGVFSNALFSSSDVRMQRIKMTKQVRM